MSLRLPFYCVCAALVGACSSAQYVTGDSRDMFDTAKGMYGGNEFTARSTEGKITYANTAPAAAAQPSAPAASAATPAAAPPAKVAPAVESPIVIDANAYAAIFGAAAGPVRPSAEELLRLDSLALVAAPEERLELQRKILACRRAAEACRITHS